MRGTLSEVRSPQAITQSSLVGLYDNIIRKANMAVLLKILRDVFLGLAADSRYEALTA